MKLTQLKIFGYHQFKDFLLDLTYPEDHEKAGQPLEKVCFVGQSGTGKSTLLWLIKEMIGSENFVVPHGPRIANIVATALLDFGDDEARGLVEFFGEGTIGNESVYMAMAEAPVNSVFYPAELKFEPFVDHKAAGYGSFVAEPGYPYGSSNLPKFQKEKTDFDFSIEDSSELWDAILKSTRDFKKKANQYSQKIANSIVSHPERLSELTREWQMWKASANNPIQHLANGLNPILNKFGLEVSTDFKIDNQDYFDFDFVKLKVPGEANDLKYKYWSSGTRKIILSAVPLFLLDTSKSVILFDEPEGSLFPDLQLDMISWYTELAPGAQFFFATQSPIIAAQFDPAERIILDFNQAGKIEWKRGVAPEGDDPNDLLTKDFGLRNLLGKKGRAKLKRYVELLGLIETEKEKSKRSKYVKEYLEIGREYGFGDEAD